MSFWSWLNKILVIFQLFREFKNLIFDRLNIISLYSNMSIDSKCWELLVPIFEDLGYKNSNREKFFKLEYQDYKFSWVDNHDTGIMIVRIGKFTDINSYLNSLRGITSVITKTEGWPKKIKILLVIKRKRISDKWHHIIFGNVDTAILSSYSFDLLKDRRSGEIHIKRILDNLNALEIRKLKPSSSVITLQPKKLKEKHFSVWWDINIYPCAVKTTIGTLESVFINGPFCDCCDPHTKLILHSSYGHPDYFECPNTHKEYWLIDKSERKTAYYNWTTAIERIKAKKTIIYFFDQYKFR